MELTPFSPLKILRHAPKVQSMISGDVVYPVSVEIDLANVCNHHCPWCSFNGFRQENWVQFPEARIFSLLQELADVGVQSVTFTGGGEPLVHKLAADVFLHAHKLGLQFGLVTNGRRLEGDVLGALAHAKFVRVSLDAGTPQTHQMLHGTSLPEFDRILSNIEKLRAVTTATIGASFCVFDVNVSEIREAACAVKRVGGNYIEVRPVFPTEWRGGGFTNPLSEAHVAEAQSELDTARAESESDGFKVIGMISRFGQVFNREKAYQRCHIGPLTTVINADGYIYHCCQQRGMLNFRAGSVLTSSFKDVWMNAQHRQMVKSINVSKCPPCRYDGYNQIIEEAFHADVMHAAFL